MDLALTYRCNNACSHCYNARSRSYPELETEEWFEILDHLWEIGIPHICFTGGEATLREDLPELILHASQLGQITGLLTNGRRLSDQAYVERLIISGLDHVQITLESHDPDVHAQMVQSQSAFPQTVKGIQNVLAAGLYVMTNTTLLKQNSEDFEQTLEFLAELGVPTVGCNALIYAGAGETVGTGLPEKDLDRLLLMAREMTDRNNQRLIWYTPTQYCHFDPVQFELGVKACTAAMYNMCIEPNGDVIPCQSFYQSVGNIREDPWERIWNHDLSLWLRERKYVPEACHDCAVLKECGGGCPLTLLQQAPIEKFDTKILLT
jgi:radical SAM protein with 4Fe4S-binding SPASM domain